MPEAARDKSQENVSLEVPWKFMTSTTSTRRMCRAGKAFTLRTKFGSAGRVGWTIDETTSARRYLCHGIYGTENDVQAHTHTHTQENL